MWGNNPGRGIGRTIAILTLVVVVVLSPSVGAASFAGAAAGASTDRPSAAGQTLATSAADETGVGADGDPTAGRSSVAATSAVSDGPRAALQASNFTSSTFLSGVNQPMGMTFLPDGRVLIIEKPGTIEISDPDDGTKDTAEYMDITGQVNDGSERGLIDITLDPNFEQNGYVYVFYSNDTEDTNRIARFTHQENGGGLQSFADPSSEFVVWKEDEQWQSCCHQGAGLDFGPDGKLWLTTGDDFQGGAVSQDLSRASGKVIRVNKDGTVPGDNPYVDDGDPNTLGEIWAYGVRNPFRAEWDLQSGRFFFGDVGGNSAPDYEEVNVATLDNPGANYGWPDCEGTSKSNEDAPCDVSQTAPVYSYPHSEGNSITGGEVYRGQQFPEEYQGAYFFGDYAKDWIKYLTFDSNGDVQSVNTFEDDANNVNAIAVGPDGSLYWTSISDGTITEVTFTGNQAPSIDSVSATPTAATSAPQTVDFSVSASDPDGDSLTYAWTFGDGSTGTGAAPSHTYQSAGVYTAYVEVSDGTRTVESRPIEITIGEPPAVTIDSPQDGSLFRAGDTISFSASGSDPQDGQLGSDAFTWDVEFDHNPPNGADHNHPVLADYTGASGSFDVPTSGHGYTTDTSYTLTVTATDSDGLSTSKSVTIEPDKVDVTFATDPSGLELSVDGLPVNDGTVFDTLIGFQHAVDAPQTQCLNGREYAFQSWSDGGAQSHDYTVPTSDATLTATYQDVGECSAPVTDGLVAQFEADQGLSTSNGQVTGWADQSGQGNDLAAAGDPTVVTAPSGQPAVSFDGSSDKLERTATLNGLPSGNGDRTVVLVTKYESVGYGGFAFGDDDSNQAFGTVVDPSGDLMVQAWGSSNDFGSGVAGTGEGWLIQSATLDSSALSHYKNGQLIDTRTHSYGTDLQQMVLGAEIDSDPYLDMEVAAVYVYDRALSDTERGQVESHLQDKYLSQETSNQAPTATDDSTTVDAGGSVTVDVLANDDDPDGSLDASTVTIDQAPTYGTATVNADGSITYTHDGSDTTSDSFVYQVSDDQGAGDAATVSVSVDQGTTDSSLPVTSGLVTHYAAGQGVSVGTGDVVNGWADQSGQGNDLTATGDPLVKHDTLAGNQVISLDGDGDALVRTDTLNGLPSGSADRTVMYVVNYQSSPNFGGGVAYGAAACNNAFGLIVHNSDLWVQGWCDDFGSGASADVGADGWMSHSAVLSSDQVTHYKNGTQVDQYTHTYNTDPQKLVIGAEIDESPYVDMEVAEVVVYDRALSDTERQQVEDYFDQRYFTPTQNTAPTASDDTATVTAGQSTTVDVLANDSDSDGTLNASSVQVTNQPTTGTATVDTDGTITYSAPSDASGDVTFTYSVADDDGATDTATVTVTVTQPTSSLPVTSGLVTHLEADQGVTTSGDTVTGWTDQSGTGIDLSSAGDPQLQSNALNGNPVVSLDGDGDKLERSGDLTGLPSGDQDRTMFVVTRYDGASAYAGTAFGNGASNEAFGLVVNGGSGKLTVQGWGGGNDIVSDTQGTGAGWLTQSAVVASDQVTHYENGSQIDSGTQTYATNLQQFVIGEEIAQNGYADMEIAAVVVYDRALSETERQGVESYLQDKYFSQGTTNQPPTASDDSATVTAGQSTTVDVLANDDDPDGSLDSSSVSIVSQPTTGTATVDTDGTITYDAPADASGDVTFTYTVADDDGATSNEATVVVSVSQPTDGSLPVTTGLVTHLEADQGVATNGDTVTGWTDQSSAGIDLSSAGDPTLVQDGLGGQPVISLDGGSDGDGDKLVRTGDLTGLPSGDQDRTMFVVTRYDSTDAYVGAAFGSGDGNQAFGTVVETGGKLTVQGWGNQNDLVSDVAGVGAGWLVQSATVSGDQVVHYKNGSQIDSGTRTYDTTLDATDSKFVIGEEIAEIGYADMDVAAVVVYDRALSDTERQQVEDYLDQKYFTPTQNAPPTADAGDDLTTAQNVTAELNASASSDPDDDALTYEWTQTAGPTVTLADANTATPSFTTPVVDANTTLTFEVTVTDEQGAVDNATVEVTVLGPPDPICSNCDTATDVDDDGLYEDVNGDEQFTFFDVLTLYDHFQNDDSPVVYAFDFDRNGELTFFDVLTLYDEFQS